MSRKDQQTLLSSNINNPLVVKNGGDVEKLPFLTEPVRLTPAWEASNLPNDELNFKGMTMERAKMEISPPIDKYKLVFFTFLLHGLGTLMPWNMFITAKSYFVDFKLHESYTHEKSEYRMYFLQYLTFASQIPNLLFNWINVFVQTRGNNLTKRIVWTIFVEIIIFLVTIILAMVDSSSWSTEFFWVTMISVIVLNVANGIYQNTVYGMAAKLPPKYTGAVILGSNISGLFSSIISFISVLISPSYRTAAIYYFITAVFVLLVAFDTYFALPLNKFYRYHEMLNEKEIKTTDNKNSIPYWKLFKQASPQLFNVFLIFFVTLSVFPAVHSDIKPVDSSFPVPRKYFTDVTCFITFNLFAMLGSLTTSWVKWPGPKYLVIFVVLRLAFVPLFILCNYHPNGIERKLPVLITDDWAYWVIAVLMSYSSGYLSSLAMMYTPQTVEPAYAVTAGMFAASFLITGIFSGVSLSFLFPTLVGTQKLDTTPITSTTEIYGF